GEGARDQPCVATWYVNRRQVFGAFALDGDFDGRRFRGLGGGWLFVGDRRRRASLGLGRRRSGLGRRRWPRLCERRFDDHARLARHVVAHGRRETKGRNGGARRFFERGLTGARLQLRDAPVLTDQYRQLDDGIAVRACRIGRLRRLQQPRLDDAAGI